MTDKVKNSKIKYINIKFTKGKYTKTKKFYFDSVFDFKGLSPILIRKQTFKFYFNYCIVIKI